MAVDGGQPRELRAAVHQHKQMQERLEPTHAPGQCSGPRNQCVDEREAACGGAVGSCFQQNWMRHNSMRGLPLICDSLTTSPGLWHGMPFGWTLLPWPPLLGQTDLNCPCYSLKVLRMALGAALSPRGRPGGTVWREGEALGGLMRVSGCLPAPYWASAALSCVQILVSGGMRHVMCH